MPLSLLARWTGRDSVPVPGPLLAWTRTAGRLLGLESQAGPDDMPHRRYGFTLDTTRAGLELAFQPTHRIGLARAGDGALTLETAPV